MGGAGGVSHVVYVGAVYADQRGTGVYQRAARLGGQERAGAEVVVATPASRPVRAEEDGPASEGLSGERIRRDGAFVKRLDHAAVEVRQPLQGKRGEVGAVGMAVE